MTTMRRTPSDAKVSQSRTEAVRAKRKQQESRKLWSSARTVSHQRVSVDRHSRNGSPSWKRHTAPLGGLTTRRWNTATPSVGGFGGARSLTNVLPHFELGWRAASAGLVMVLLAVLFHLLSSPRYFINSINLSGSLNIPGEEIYRASDVDNVNIFWIDPAQVKLDVESVPGIQNAQVEVRWPNQVYLAVIENEPALSWSQAGQTMWVDRAGVVFPARSEIPGLLPIVVDDAAYPLTPESRIPAEAIEGALQLKELRNNIELLHYDAINGLSYQDGRHWRGYFGVGTDMEVKLNVYETLIGNLLSRNIQPVVVNVVNADAPFYRR